MPTFTITDVSPNVRDWNSQQGGPMKEYRVHLAERDQRHMNVEWSRKATSPAPTEGQQIEGTLEDRGQHGLKLKVAPSFGGGGFARPEDPKRAARILRQHSQDMAMQAIRLAVDLNVMRVVDPERPTDTGGHPETTKELFDLIARTADWFDADAEKAAK